MTVSLVRRLLKVFPIVAVGIVLLGGAAPVQAMSCFTDLATCYMSAANVDGFWLRWAAGLDCELGFISCVRIDVIGR